MKPLPPINDAILVALAQLVDDAQTGRRDPSHDQIGFCIEKAGLKSADPVAQGQPVGKAKRLRAVFSQALNEDFEAAQKLFDAACAVNRLRNKEGTGHGRPWLPMVTSEEAQAAAQTMGIVSGLLLNALRMRKP